MSRGTEEKSKVARNRCLNSVLSGVASGSCITGPEQQVIECDNWLARTMPSAALSPLLLKANVLFTHVSSSCRDEYARGTGRPCSVVCLQKKEKHASKFHISGDRSPAITGRSRCTANVAESTSIKVHPSAKRAAKPSKTERFSRPTRTDSSRVASVGQDRYGNY